MTRPMLRLCASYSDLSRQDCSCPDRCIERNCTRCGTPVHYDPKACLPFLGTELILCLSCAGGAADLLLTEPGEFTG